MRGKSRSNSLQSSQSNFEQGIRYSRYKAPAMSLDSVLSGLSALERQIQGLIYIYPQQSQKKYIETKCVQLELQLQREVKLRSELAEMYKNVEAQVQSLRLQINLLHSDADSKAQNQSNQKLIIELEETKHQAQLYKQRCQFLEQQGQQQQSLADLKKQLISTQKDNLTLKVKLNHFQRMVLKPDNDQKTVSQSSFLAAICFHLQKISIAVNQCKKSISFQGQLQNQIMAQAEVDKMRSQFQLVNYLNMNTYLKKQLSRCQQKIIDLEKEKLSSSSYEGREQLRVVTSSSFTDQDYCLQKNLKQIEHKIRQNISSEGNHIKTLNGLNSHKYTNEQHNHVILLELYIAELQHATKKLIGKNQHLLKHKVHFQKTLQKYETLLVKYKHQIQVYERLPHKLPQKVPHNSLVSSNREQEDISRLLRQPQGKLPIFLELFETIQQQAQLQVACAKQELETLKFHFEQRISEMSIELQEMNNLKKMLQYYKQKNSKLITSLTSQQLSKQDEFFKRSKPTSYQYEELMYSQSLKTSSELDKIHKSYFAHQQAKKEYPLTARQGSGNRDRDNRNYQLRLDQKLEKELLSSMEDKQFLSHKVKFLENQMQVANSQIQNLQERKQAIVANLKQSQHQRQLLQKRIQVQYIPKLSERNKIEEENVELRKQIILIEQSKNSDSHSQFKQHQTFTDQINDLKTNEQNLIRQLSKKQLQLENLRQQIIAKDENLKHLREQLENKQTVIKQLQPVNAQSQDKVKEIESRFEESVKLKDEQIQKLSSQICRLKEQNGTLLVKESSFSEQKINLECRIHGRQIQFDEQNHENKKLINDLEIVNKLLEDELEKLNLELQTKQQRIAELTDERDSLERRMILLQDKIKEPRTRKVSLQEEIQFQEGEGWITKNDQLQQELDRVIGQLHSSKEENRGLAEKLEASEQAYKVKVAELDDIIAQLSDKIIHMEEIKVIDLPYASLGRISSSNSCNQRIARTELESLKQSIKMMESQIRNKDQRILKMASELNQYSKLARKVDKYEKTLNQRAEELSKLRQQYNQAILQNRALRQMLNTISQSPTAASSTLKESMDLQASLKNSYERLQGLEVRFKKMNLQKLKLQQSLKQTSDDLKKAEQNINTITEENHKLNQRLFHMQSTQQMQRQQYDSLFRNMQQSISTILMEKEQQINAEQTQLKSAVATTEDLQGQSKRHLQAELNKLKITIGKQEIQIGNLRNVIIELTGKLSSQQDLDPQIEEMLRKIKEGAFEDLVTSRKQRKGSWWKNMKLSPGESQQYKSRYRPKSHGVDSSPSELHTVIIDTPSNRESKQSGIVNFEVQKTYQIIGELRDPEKEDGSEKQEKPAENLYDQRIQATSILFRKSNRIQEEEVKNEEQFQSLNGSRKAFGQSIRKVAEVGKLKSQKVLFISQTSSSKLETSKEEKIEE